MGRFVKVLFILLYFVGSNCLAKSVSLTGKILFLIHLKLILSNLIRALCREKKKLRRGILNIFIQGEFVLK